MKLHDIGWTLEQLASCGALSITARERLKAASYIVASLNAPGSIEELGDQSRVLCAVQSVAKMQDGTEGTK